MARKFLTSIDLCGNQLIRPVLENVSPNPEDSNSLAKGRIAFNTGDNKPIVYDGEHWRNLQYEIPSGTYLDSASYKSLVAIDALTGTSGILKKTDADNWELDTNTYLLSNANAVSATKLEIPRAFSITGGATASAINFNGESNVALEVTTLNASKLTETIPSTVLERSTLYVGTTPIKLNRPSGALALTGISSIGLDSGNDTKPIIKYKDVDNAIYLTTGDNGALNLHVTGELTTSNILNNWDKYSEEKANWFLSAELGNDLHTKMENKSDDGHTHTLASLTERSYDNLTNKPSLGTAASLNTGIASGDIPVLGASGKLNDSVIPKIAISETSVVASEEDMLNLTAETGDIAIRTDANKSFILRGDDPKVLSNWEELITPTSPVQSVAGKKGEVTLAKEDVGLDNVDNVKQEPANANIQAHVTSSHAPSNAQKNSDITKAEIEAKLTGAITTHTHSQYLTTYTDTTYTAKTNGGLKLEGTVFEVDFGTGATQVAKGNHSHSFGVLSIVTGTTNGTISVNTNGVSANVAVEGLKSAAYTASTEYAKASHNHSASNITSGTLAVARGGTGLTDAKNGFTRKVVGTLTTSATSYSITHELGTDVVVQVIEVASKAVVECDIIMTSVDKVTIQFNKAPAANAYRYIIVG